MSTLLKENARKTYSTIGRIKCPAFPKEKIAFNAKGFSHLFYQGRDKSRSRAKQESQTRIKLLPRVVKLLKLMPIPQEESTYHFKGKSYKFWAFEGVVDKRRIKVIVRQVGKGQKHFWSVVPSWRKTRFGRKNAKGNLAKQ